MKDPTWPYEDLETAETSESEPDWACAEAVCLCTDDRSVVEPERFAIVLCDEDAVRMRRARCRVLSRGLLLNTEPKADESGLIEVKCKKLPAQVLVEWAPENTPLEPRFPFRKLYYVDLATRDMHESARRRLHNLGFSRRLTLDDNIRDFQRAYKRRETGRLADVKQILVDFHDQGLIPPIGTDTEGDIDLHLSIAQQAPVPATQQLGGPDSNQGVARASEGGLGPKLRDITHSKVDLVDAGAQTGRVPPDPDEVSCGYPPGTAPLPLVPILNPDEAACGAARLRTEKRSLVKQLRGTLRVLLATSPAASLDPPAMFLIWIPDNLTTLDFHVYFMPLIDLPRSLPYPLGRAGREGDEQPYVGKGYQHLMWRSWGAYQHDLTRVSCIYVVPVPSTERQFYGLTAAKLAEWLREIASIVVQIHGTGPQQGEPSIGKVSLSGFSYGGNWVGRILSLRGGEKGELFVKHNVGEVYIFDLPNIYAHGVAAAVRAWQTLRSEDHHRVRVYTQYGTTFNAFAPLVQFDPSDRTSIRYRGASAGAMEANSARGTVLLLPAPLFSEACGKRGNNDRCAIPIGTNTHDWFMRFFMAHALETSWFARIVP